MECSMGKSLFERMYPGFFERSFIRRIAPGVVYEEMILRLDEFTPEQVEISAAHGIEFGLFDAGDMEMLLESVRQVDEEWVQYFRQPGEVFCAFDGGRVVSFCLLDDMGVHDVNGRRVRIAGPGCVGTIPAYRRRGIGLRMVQEATRMLKDRGYDYSYIHYTAVGAWYAKLGYETLVRWDKDGVIGESASKEPQSKYHP